jgi:hypothetical protein
MPGTVCRHVNYRKIPFPEIYGLYNMNIELWYLILNKTKHKRNIWIIFWDMLKFEAGACTATFISYCVLSLLRDCLWFMVN